MSTVALREFLYLSPLQSPFPPLANIVVSIVPRKKHKEKINFRKYFGALMYNDDCPLRNSHFIIIGCFILIRRSWFSSLT